MCYSGCPYERWSGECGGKGRLTRGQPHCAYEDEYLEALAARDDMLCERQNCYEGLREERRISNR